MTPKRLVSALSLAVVLGGAAAYRVRNPERLDLDAAARRQAPGQFLTLGDGVTHYDVAGPDSGQRVVLVHGFSVPSYIWDSTSIALAAAGFRGIDSRSSARCYGRCWRFRGWPADN